MAKTIRRLRSMKELEELLSNSRSPVTLLIEMPGYPEYEKITNPVANLPMKLKYYEDTYDYSLNHKYAGGIRIVGYEVFAANISVGVNVDMSDLDAALLKADELTHKLKEAKELGKGLIV